jgi:hypothetical protein
MGWGKRAGVFLLVLFVWGGIAMTVGPFLVGYLSYAAVIPYWAGTVAAPVQAVFKAWSLRKVTATWMVAVQGLGGMIYFLIEPINDYHGWMRVPGLVKTSAICLGPLLVPTLLSDYLANLLLPRPRWGGKIPVPLGGPDDPD